jgi:hypothetical protein
MKRNPRWILGPLGAVVLSGCSVFGIRSGYEQPAYEVVDRVAGGIEVRRYGPRLAAETTVEEADADTSRSAAFRILAAYIFGANRPKTEVAMTAPVEVDSRPRKIAMTAPVETAEAGEGRTVMRFFLPRSLTLATAPEPNDPRVRLVTVPEETLAVLRFTGWRDADAVAERSEQLLSALEGSAWRPLATPVGLFYDPPWTLPFLRRNEVAVAVGRR